MARRLILPAILAVLVLPLTAQNGSNPAIDDTPTPACPCANGDGPCGQGGALHRGPGPGGAPGMGHGWHRRAGRGHGFGPGAGRGAGQTVCMDALNAVLDDLPAGTLDAGETAAVLYLLEEEKLSRDVYRALGETWGLPIFDRIATSEQHHMELMALLVERYGLEDPIADDGAGVFTDPRLAALYDEMVTRGRGSLTAALEVGVAIEEMDLADLTRSHASADDADVRAVYERLMFATRHHLRAFNAQLG